jgi:hypothetical protein
MFITSRESAINFKIPLYAITPATTGQAWEEIPRIHFPKKCGSSESSGLSIYQPPFAAGQSEYPRFIGFYEGFLESNQTGF